MPLWTSALLAGGTIYAGVRVVQNRRRKKLVEYISGPEYSMMIIESDRPLSLGDWLFGDETRWSRTQRRYRANFNLAIATGAMALTGVGALVPGLTFAGTLLVVVAAIEIYRDAISALINDRRIRHSVIDALAITTALSFGLYIQSAVATGLYFLGMRMLIAAETQTTRHLTDLFAQQERFVWRLVEGERVQVALGDLQPGDVIVVEAGEHIPVDGEIMQGIASVDQHVLTGESQPITKAQGDVVYAATMVNTGLIEVAVREAGTDTIAMEIAQLLAAHMYQKAQMTSEAEAIADRAAPPTLGVASLALASGGLLSAAAVLNANFSEILRVTMPLSLLNHIDIATQHGILVKDAQALDALHTVDTIIFDKTGTLTVDRPTIFDIHTVADASADDILWYAALAEQRQSHPIAHAIMAEVARRGIEVPELDDSAYEAGFGLRVRYQDQTVTIGSDRYFALHDLSTEIFAEQAAAGQARGHSCVFVAIDYYTVGMIELASQAAPNAEAVVMDLQARGFEVQIVSGDHESPTQHLAEQLGITTFVAQRLPQQKAEWVESLQAAGHRVCFIGDGINDALALQRADVSISLNRGASLAVDTAQIILHDDLTHLLIVLDLTEQYHSNVRRTISLIYGPGLLCIGSIFVFQATIATALSLYYLSFVASMGSAMLPWVRDRWQQHHMGQIATSARQLLPESPVNG